MVQFRIYIHVLLRARVPSIVNWILELYLQISIGLQQRLPNLSQASPWTKFWSVDGINRGLSSGYEVTKENEEIWNEVQVYDAVSSTLWTCYQTVALGYAKRDF